MLVVIDCGTGNLQSVVNAALFLGIKVRVTDSKTVIKKATKIIFPGVGNFSKAAAELKKKNIFPTLKKKIADGVPFLGICLGMQLLFEESQEAPGVEGLGVIRGRVKKIRGKGLVVPHMGWNRMEPPRGRSFRTKLLRGVGRRSFFYFAHSYRCCPLDKKVVLAVTDYGNNSFVSAVNDGNVWGVQFHPEKSQKAGLRIFNNFCGE